MKKLCFAVIILILIGCSVTREQFQVHSLDANRNRCKSSPFINMFCFEDSTLRLNYNFWSEGGEVKFTLKNKTDQTIFLDWENSHLITNGFSSTYADGSQGSLPDSIPANSSTEINEIKLNITFKDSGSYNYYTSPYLWENKIGYKIHKNDLVNYLNTEFWLENSTAVADYNYGSPQGYDNYFYGYSKEEKITDFGKVGYTLGGITIGVLYLASYALTDAETDSI